MAQDRKVSSQDTRRAARDAVYRGLNELAKSSGLEDSTIALRAKKEEVETLYAKLARAVDDEGLAELRALREQWLDNGGSGEFPEELLARPQSQSQASQADESAGAGDGTDDGAPESFVHGHRAVQQSFYAPGRSTFRLKSKAFMLTFNSLSFVPSQTLWAQFVTWVKQKMQEHKATSWSAAMEESLHSADCGRVHLHVYFSWQGAGATGVNHTTTDAWVFQNRRPRVDVNSEARGPYEWLRAVQHGHFYVSVHKKGAVFTDSNYKPWVDNWVPEAWWVVSLWKQHKLEHDAYLRLSVKLRDGHDRR